MSQELAELVGFLHDTNAQVRALAVHNLVAYSASNPEVFKGNDGRPIRDLKLLIYDHPSTAQLAMTCLINLTQDAQVQSMCCDRVFLSGLLRIIEDHTNEHADLASMLLLNVVKCPEAVALASMETNPAAGLDTRSRCVLEQLCECFVKGRSFNKHAGLEHLGSVIADLSRFEQVRKLLLQNPVLLRRVFSFMTEGPSVSVERRRASAIALRNIALDHNTHDTLMAMPVDALSLLLPPLIEGRAASARGGDDDSDKNDDSEYSGMGETELAALRDSNHHRDDDKAIRIAACEALLALGALQRTRETMRTRKVYPVIRDLHKALAPKVSTERRTLKLCDAIVQTLMRDEHPDNAQKEDEAFADTLHDHLAHDAKDEFDESESSDDDEEDKIVEVA